MRPIPKAAEAFIKKHEQLVLRVYDDKHPKRILKPGDPIEGVLTGGWGHTGGLHIGQEVTRAQAQEWFDSDVLNKAIKPLYKKIPGVIDELTDGQWGALISFVFNLGTGDPKKPEWTIWKRLRARQFDQVPQEMAKFVNWNGKKSAGLVKRRNAEIDLWSEEEPGSSPHTPPSSVTRREATPPTPSDPVPPQRSASLYTVGTTAVAGVGVAVSQVQEVVEPYRYQNDALDNWIAILAVVGAVAAIVGLVLTYLNKRKARS